MCRGDVRQHARLFGTTALFVSCFAGASAVGRNLRAEFVAPYPKNATQRSYVPSDHPQQTTDHAPGLPESCITYEEKYKNLSEGPVMADPNEAHPSARDAVIIRMHFGIAWRHDLTLHLRSLMRDTSNVGMHIIILFQISAKLEAAEDSTPEKFRHSVPPEFRPITYFFDEADVHNAYNKLHQFRQHSREYLPLVWFLHRFPGYRFAWYMEYDVRYTGPSMTDFLNAAMHKAIATTREPRPAGDALYRGASEALIDDVQSEAPQRVEGVPLPAERTPLPDLLLMGDGVHTTALNDTFKPRDYEADRNWNFSSLHHRQVQLMGISRRLADTLHLYSLEGLGGFIEEFVPSLAMETNMTVVSIPIAEFGGKSFHCCFEHAEDFYLGWFTTGHCRQAALLHPIKLGARAWREQDVKAAEAAEAASS